MKPVFEVCKKNTMETEIMTSITADVTLIAIDKGYNTLAGRWDKPAKDTPSR